MPLSRLALLPALLLPAFAVAQAEPPSGPPDQPGATKLEKIEVIAPDSLGERRESTAARIVVNRDEIQKYGDTTILDVMKRLPGVTVRGTSIMMRGLSSYTQILVNGEPVPPGFSLETLSPDLIERIEIYRSATAEFSTQAVAGTINIILRKPVSHAQSEAKVGVNVANGQLSANASVQFSDKVGDLAYTLPVNVNRNRNHAYEMDEQRVSDASGRLVQRYRVNEDRHFGGENVGFTPRLAWTLGSDNTLNVDGFLNFNHYRAELVDRYGGFIGTPPQLADTTTDIDARSVVSRLNGTWIRKLANDARLEVKGGVNYNHRRSSWDMNSFDASDVFVLHRTTDAVADDSGATTQGKYVLPFVEGHSFNLGWDGAFAKRTETRVQVDQSPVGLAPFNIDQSYDARVYRIAGYGQDDWDVTPRLSVYLGLRWEGIETRTVGNNIDDVLNRSAVWSPIAQVLWKLPEMEKDQVRAGIARTYKAPSTYQLIPRRFIASNNTQTTPDYQGNPDLKPELALGLDVAYEHYFTAGGLFSASGFARRIDDSIQYQLFFADGRYITHQVNRGRAYSRGIELDMKTPLKTWWAAAPAVDLRANYSHYWSRVDALPPPDNRLDSQVPYTGNVGFDWKLATVPLTLGGSFTIQGEGTVRTSLTQRSYSTVTRTLEAYGLWKFAPKTQLRVTLGNILAQDRVDVNQYFDGITAVELTSVNPSWRRLSALLEVKF